MSNRLCPIPLSQAGQFSAFAGEVSLLLRRSSFTLRLLHVTSRAKSGQHSARIVGIVIVGGAVGVGIAEVIVVVVISRTPARPDRPKGGNNDGHVIRGTPKNEVRFFASAGRLTWLRPSKARFHGQSARRGFGPSYRASLSPPSRQQPCPLPL